MRLMFEGIKIASVPVTIIKLEPVLDRKMPSMRILSDGTSDVYVMYLDHRGNGLGLVRCRGAANDSLTLEPSNSRIYVRRTDAASV